MINIDDTDVIAKFWNALTSSSNNLALSQLWLVTIPRQEFSKLDNIFLMNLKNYEGWIGKWDIFSDSADTYHPRAFLDANNFYATARGVSFPGDSLNIGYVGSSQTGLLKAPIVTERADLPQVTITFLETNQSVADLFFRPWMIMLGHWSLKEQLLRTNITLTCFQKSGKPNAGNSLIRRKVFVLEQAAPVYIDTEEYNYTADKVIDRQIKFVYSRYHVIANEGGPAWSTDDSQQYELHSTRDLEPPAVPSVITPGQFEATATIPRTPTDFPVPEAYMPAVKVSLFGKMAQAYSLVRARAAEIEGQTAKAMREAGMDHAAAKLEENLGFNAQERALGGVGNIISTGSRLADSFSSFSQLGQNVMHPIMGGQAAEDAASEAALQQSLANSSERAPLWTGLEPGSLNGSMPTGELPMGTPVSLPGSMPSTLPSSYPSALQANTYPDKSVAATALTTGAAKDVVRADPSIYPVSPFPAPTTPVK